VSYCSPAQYGCSPGSPSCLRRALPNLARQLACRRNGFIIQVAMANRARIVQGRATLMQEVQMDRVLRRDRGPGTGLQDNAPGSRPGVPPWCCWKLRVDWNCRWWQCWPLRRCRWWWSTPARCETSPGLQGRWPRPTLWTQRSWLTLPKRSDLGLIGAWDNRSSPALSHRL